MIWSDQEGPLGREGALKVGQNSLRRKTTGAKAQGWARCRINPRGARQKPDHTATSEKRSRGPSAYLDKDHSTNGFQDQHDCHGEGVDAGIVVHERIVLHAVAHRCPVFLSHSRVLFGSKVL